MALGAVCYHCGAADPPVFDDVLNYWICPACRHYRSDAHEWLFHGVIMRRLAERLPRVIWRIPRLRSWFW